MKRALKIYLEKPELAGILLLIVLMAFFEVPIERHFPLVSEHPRRARAPAGGRGGDDRLRDADDLRRIRSVGRIGFRDHADEHRAHAERWRPVLAGVRGRRPDLRFDWLPECLHHAQVRYSELHHHAWNAFHGALADHCDVGRFPPFACSGQGADGVVLRTSSAAVSSAPPSPGSWRLFYSPRQSCRGRTSATGSVRRGDSSRRRARWAFRSPGSSSPAS